MNQRFYNVFGIGVLTALMFVYVLQKDFDYALVGIMLYLYIDNRRYMELLDGQRNLEIQEIKDRRI